MPFRCRALKRHDYFLRIFGLNIRPKGASRTLWNRLFGAGSAKPRSPVQAASPVDLCSQAPVVPLAQSEKVTVWPQRRSGMMFVLARLSSGDRERPWPYLFHSFASLLSLPVSALVSGAGSAKPRSPVQAASPVDLCSQAPVVPLAQSEKVTVWPQRRSGMMFVLARLSSGDRERPWPYLFHSFA